MFRVFQILIFTIALTAFAHGQDLGSSNKLFGAKPDKAKPTAAKKARAPKPKRSTPVRSSSSTAAKKDVKKARTPAVTAKAKVKPDAPAAKDKPSDTSAKLPKKLSTDTKKTPVATTPKPAEKETALSSADKATRLKNLIDEGNAARDARNFEKAETAYRAALKIAPDSAYVETALSGILALPLPAADLGDRYDEAEKLARSATAKEPKNAVAFDRLGSAMEMRGLIGPETESAYRTAISLDDSYTPAYAHLARLLRRTGRQAEAAELDAAAATRAKDARALATIAEVLQSEQRYPASLRLLTIAAQNDPKDALVLDLLGRALMAGGDLANAEANFRRSLALEPANFDVYSLLASLYLRNNDIPRAESMLLQGSRFANGYEKFALARQFEQIGDEYARSGRAAESQRSYKMALTYQPKRETVLAKLSAHK